MVNCNFLFFIESKGVVLSCEIISITLALSIFSDIFFVNGGCVFSGTPCIFQNKD